jgi:hypothetical protein
MLVAVLMLEVPGYAWLKATPEQKWEVKTQLAKRFSAENGFCRAAQIWTVFSKDKDSYQIWIRCIDTERRC